MRRFSFEDAALFSLVLLLAGCSTEGAPASTGEAAAEETAEGAGQPPAGDATQSGAVLEAIGASGYTYLRVDTGQGEVWLAAPQLAVEVGDRVRWAPGMLMQGWHSDTLDRTWDEVRFISQIQVEGAEPAPPAMPPGHPPVAAPPPAAADSGPVEKLEGGFTVAQIHSRAAELAGQRVAVRGRVVKANLGIMGSNWLHVRDGSGDAEGGSNDLTVTTNGQAEVGDVVVVEGTLATDKDFGAGYRYAVIVEDAAVTIDPRRD